MTSPLRSLAFVLFAGLFLGACSLREVGETFENPRPWPNERRVLARDWVVPDIKAKEGRVYCYRSLGAIECYPYPIAGASTRYVEDYTPVYRPPTKAEIRKAERKKKAKLKAEIKAEIEAEMKKKASTRNKK